MVPTYHQVIILNVWRPIFGIHDDVINWKDFPRNWPFVRGIVWSPVNSPCIGQWRSALLFPYICDWRSWVNNREAGDLRRYRAHYDITVMYDIQVIVNQINVYNLSCMLVSHSSWLICFVQILSMIKWDWDIMTTIFRLVFPYRMYCIDSIFSVFCIGSINNLSYLFHFKMICGNTIVLNLFQVLI